MYYITVIVTVSLYLEQKYLNLRTDWLKMSESIFVQKDTIKCNESGAVFTTFNLFLT
jgi:hypothetical protein